MRRRSRDGRRWSERRADRPRCGRRASRQAPHHRAARARAGVIPGVSAGSPRQGRARRSRRSMQRKRRPVIRCVRLPRSGAIKPMPEAEIAKAVQLLDVMLEHFADDGHWTRGRYDDGNGGHCLVGALLHLSRKHRLPRAPAIALLQDAMPRPGLPLVHFNDTCCGSVAELRSHHPQSPPPRRRSRGTRAGGRRG
jgi:hypothetical protein